MKLCLRSLPIVLSLAVAGTAHAKAWDDVNDPSLLDGTYEYRFSALPLEGELELKPWSETYWETALGSINIRWNQENPQGFNYGLYSRDQIMSMSKEQLATLSPSEKYDIYLGNYDFPLHKEVSGFASPHVAFWKGICDGWSMTAVQFPEPKPVEAKNPDGVVVPFGSSDIKGLLSYYAQFRSGMKKTYVGGQCRKLGSWFGSSACADINPGAMHVILANQIGLKHKAFMMDRDPGPQIWNQPVYGFKTTVLGSARSDAAQGVLVHTDILYTDELDKSSWAPVVGTPQFKMDTMKTDYVLDLDSEGRIVGGSYVNHSDHPDLFWLPQGEIKLEDDFSQLNTLLK